MNEGRAVWFSLPGGAPLYEAGEEADQFYFLRTGRLGAFRKQEGHEIQFLGVIRPGEPAGEMALVAGAPHSATVTALRDSEVLALGRDDFFDAVASDPTVMTELARLMILRNRQSASGVGAGRALGVRLHRVVAGGQGARAGRANRGADRPAGLSHHHCRRRGDASPDRMVLQRRARPRLRALRRRGGRAGLKSLVGRQGDRLFRIAMASDPPPPPLPDALAAEPLQVQQLTDLILLHPAGQGAPIGSEAWVTSLRPARLFHLRDGHGGDADRLARVLTGQSVGLVLSGGGARAYAHVGAVRALRERGVPIDFIAASRWARSSGPASPWAGTTPRSRPASAAPSSPPARWMTSPFR
ncbi:MAG: cyclic nucleotide-binding domain-containing protein [Caulobacteraceae bacterium]